MQGERQDPEAAPAALPQDAFRALVERHRRYESDLTALAHEAEAILREREEDARTAADQIVLEARLEAARLLSHAREEVRALAEQVASLRHAQHEAAEALQHTRRTLDEALGLPGATRTVDRRDEAARIDRAPADEETERHAAEQATHAPAPVTSSHGRRVPIAAAATLVVLVAIAALWIWGRERGPEPVSSRDAKAGQPAAPAAPALPKPASPRTGSAPRTEAASAVPGSGVDSRPERREITPDPAAAPTAARRDSAPDTGSRPLTVDIEARRPVWLRATIDGERGPGGTLSAGRRRRITADEAVIIRTGDAGALMFSVNGSALQPFGADGAIRTRRFERPAASSTAPEPKPTQSRETPRQSVAPSQKRSDSAVAATGGVSASPPAGVSASPGTAPLLQTPAAQVLPPTAPPRSSAAARDADDVAAEIVEADRRWFDAYYRGDRASVARLSAEGFDLTDGRPPDRRVPPGVKPERVLLDPQVDVHGDGAVLSGRMIERAASNGTTREYESFVSQVWVRREGTWRLLGLRLATGDALREAAGRLR